MTTGKNSLILGALNDLQQKHKDLLMVALKPYVPEAALELCCELIMYYKLNLVATEILKKNNWMCEVELDGDGKLKKVDGLVLMVVK